MSKILKYKRYLLDTSAVISFIKQEPGAELVTEIIGNCYISSVNFAEVAKYLVEYFNSTANEVENIVGKIVEDIIPVDHKIALLSAEMLPNTKALVLSLGDRICIATGILKQYPIVTTDRAWLNCNIPNAQIILARNNIN